MHTQLVLKYYIATTKSLNLNALCNTLTQHIQENLPSVARFFFSAFRAWAWVLR